MKDSDRMQIRLRYQYLFLVLLVHISFCTSDIDCEKDCNSFDYTNPNFKPQDCARQCGDDTDDARKDFEELMKEMSSLRIMVIVLLSLVVLLILLFMVVFVRKLKLKQIFRKYYPKFSNKSSDLEKGKDDANIKDAVIRMNYSESPDPVLSSNPQMTSSIRRADSFSKSAQELSPLDTMRRRMPSESTCPDESQIEHNGYDNLALSTSSINFHSRPSSPSSPNEVTSSSDTVELSMNPLNTTMTTVQIDYGEENSPRTVMT